MPSAPSSTIAEVTPLSPDAPSAASAEVGVASPAAPSGPTGFGFPDPSNLAPAPVFIPAAISFEPCFAPELPNGGNLRTVPGLTIQGRSVFTSSATAADELEGLVLVQDEPITGIWVSTYYDGTTWRFDVWLNGELMIYWRSASSAYANPGAVPLWVLGDIEGSYPDSSWSPAQMNAFGIQMTAAGCVVVPTYSPLLSEPLLRTPSVAERPFFAIGEDPQWDGESGSGFDLALVYREVPAAWLLGELTGETTWIFLGDKLTPPIGAVSDESEANCKGNLRLILAPPAAVSPVNVYTAPSPSAPSPAV